MHATHFSLGKNLIIMINAQNAPIALATGGAPNPNFWKRIPPIIGAGKAIIPLKAASFPATIALRSLGAIAISMDCAAGCHATPVKAQIAARATNAGRVWAKKNPTICTTLRDSESAIEFFAPIVSISRVAGNWARTRTMK